MIWRMADVWVHGWALAALIVSACCLLLLVVFAFAIWLRVVEVARVLAPRPGETTKSPAQPGG